MYLKLDLTPTKEQIKEVNRKWNDLFKKNTKKKYIISEATLYKLDHARLKD